MSEIYVIKKDGSKEIYTPSKIQSMADFACLGTKCSSLDLQTSLQFSIKNGTKTSFIHSQMIMESINKIGQNNDDYSTGVQWRLVAGRLKMLENIKQNRMVSNDFGFDIGLDGDEDFEKFLEYHLENNLYDKKLIANHSIEEISKLWYDTVKIEKNYEYIIESVITTQEKFLIGLETPQHMYFIICFIYAKRFCELFPETNLRDKVKEFYNDVSDKKVSFPSVILSELRKPNANLASCFIGKFSDDAEEIMELLKDFAMISKKGGGIGANLDSIRAFKSWLMKKKGKATGVVPLLKVLNDLMIYMNQSGVKPGALTPSLSAWHMDIMSFFKTQQLGGEERDKAMDLFLQLVANDKFMIAMDEDKDWYTFDPYELKTKFNIDLGESFGEKFNKDYEFLIEKTKTGELELYNKIRAKDIFKESLRTSINRGTPYWFFKDSVNKVSNMKNAGTIHCGNLCQESFSVFDQETTHTCNLLSLVHPFITDLRHTTRLAMELLDLTVDLGVAPTKASSKHNDEIRAVGLGSMGLADWCAKNAISYQSDKGVQEISKLFEKVAYYSIERSHELGKLLGSFKRHSESEWAKGNIFGKTIEEIKAKSLVPDLDWDKLSYLVSIALRNGWLLAIAPNTTSSSAIGVSASILPTFSKFFVEETATGNIPRMPLYIEENPLGYTDYKYIDKYKMNTVIATIQFWTDGGISYEQVFDLNLPENRDVNTIFNFYMDAWKKGIKTIYYIRWIKPGTDKMAEKTECIGCAG
jgi:ribonucleoside-diphosphate reductase alpha chain